MVDGLLWVILFLETLLAYSEYKYCVLGIEKGRWPLGAATELSWLSEIVTMQENTWLGVKIKDKHLKFRDGGVSGL